jgi:hypothetical protein
MDSLTYDSLTSGGFLSLNCDTRIMTSQDFSDVKRQLDTEFGYVPVVWGFINDLKAPLLLQSTSAQAALQQVADDVSASVQPAPSAKLTYDPLGVTEEMLKGIAALPVVGEAADALELIAAGIGIVESTTLDPANGNTPELSGPSTVEVDKFAEQLADQYAAAAEHFDQIAEILVGDWDKLQTAATNAQTGPWIWSSALTQRAAAGLNFAARRFAYTSLFPLAYGGLLRGTKGDSTFPDPVDPSVYDCEVGQGHGEIEFFPFAHTEQFGGVTAFVGGGPQEESWVFSTPTQPNRGDPAEGNGIYSDFRASLPSAALLREMFGDKAPGVSKPALTGLAFVLSIRDQLQVLTIYHSTAEDANGTERPNVCVGNLTGWPSNL